MLLAHGTSSENFSNILSNGLVPRGTRKGNWFKEYQHKSIARFVYLAGINDISGHELDFYSLRTACIRGGECLIVTVDVDEDNLYPDDNLFQTSLLYDKEELKEMQKQVLKNKSRWKESLDIKNKVSHDGKIPPQRIVDTKITKREDNQYFCFIKHTKQTIDDFDMSINVYNKLIQENWFSDLVDRSLPEPESHEKIMRELVIKPNYCGFYVNCFGKEVIIEVPG